MRLLAEWFPEFAEEFDKIDELYKKKRTIDEKTYQFICFALSIKNRSKPCLVKHFMGALEAGATAERDRVYTDFRKQTGMARGIMPYFRIFFGSEFGFSCKN